MTTRAQMENGISEFCNKNTLKYELGTEDGFLWIEVWGDTVGFKNVEEISKQLSVAAGINFYLSAARSHSFKGPLDCDREDSSYKSPTAELVPAHIEIKQYGTLFTPAW